MTELRLAAQAAGADARALAQVGDGHAIGGDDAVAHVVAPANGRKAEPRGNVGGHILNAVHGKVDGLFDESLFELLDKDALAADLRERGALQLVTRGFDDDDFGLDTGGSEELPADEFGLPLGEQTAASADAKVPHGFSPRSRNRSRMASRFCILRRSSFSPRRRCVGSIRRCSSKSSIMCSMRVRESASSDCREDARSRTKAARCSRTRERRDSTRLPSSTLACQERNLPTCSSTIDSARGTSLSRALRFCSTMSVK